MTVAPWVVAHLSLAADRHWLDLVYVLLASAAVGGLALVVSGRRARRSVGVHPAPPGSGGAGSPARVASGQHHPE